MQGGESKERPVDSLGGGNGLTCKDAEAAGICGTENWRQEALQRKSCGNLHRNPVDAAAKS